MNISRPLAGMAAILCAAGLALTGTAGANATEVRAVDMPDHIVNGDFEAYPLGGTAIPDPANGDWTSVDTVNGEYYDVAGAWRPIKDFDPTVFGWTSDQEDGNIGNPGEQRAHAVELQRDWSGNTYAEITAAQPNTAIRQTIRTIPGAVYTIRLDHASLVDMHVDEMKVVVGGETVPMTRTSVNGHGDKLGETSEIVRTTVSNKSRTYPASTAAVTTRANGRPTKAPTWPSRPRRCSRSRACPRWTTARATSSTTSASRSATRSPTS